MRMRPWREHIATRWPSFVAEDRRIRQIERIESIEYCTVSKHISQSVEDVELLQSSVYSGDMSAVTCEVRE